MGETASADAIGQRLAEVRERIAAAGGDPTRVTVVGVTKAFGPDLAVRAASAGLTDLGENYAQELQAKVEDWPDAVPRPRWHFIGGLQRNKIKRLAATVDLWHTIDRVDLVTELAKRAPDAALLIQVNTTGEPQKSGCEPSEVAGLVDAARSLGLDVQGLMTVGPTGGADPRPGFDLLRELGRGLELAELSMGMSGDFELAVAEGATIIRVGTVLFGDRPPRENHRPGLSA